MIGLFLNCLLYNILINMHERFGMRRIVCWDLVESIYTKIFVILRSALWVKWKRTQKLWKSWIELSLCVFSQALASKDW